MCWLIVPSLQKSAYNSSIQPEQWLLASNSGFNLEAVKVCFAVFVAYLLHGPPVSLTVSVLQVLDELQPGADEIVLPKTSSSVFIR